MVNEMKHKAITDLQNKFRPRMNEIIEWFRTVDNGVDMLVPMLPLSKCPNCPEEHIHPSIDLLLPMQHVAQTALKFTDACNSQFPEQISEESMAAMYAHALKELMRFIQDIQRLCNLTVGWLDEVGIKLEDTIPPPPVSGFEPGDEDDRLMMSTSTAH
jgi:hypothetical protein